MDGNRQVAKSHWCSPGWRTEWIKKKVYGKDRAFDTVEDQEEYVRTWLRGTAAMKDASEELNIAWYPARQEPAGDCVYSMGDITALVPVSATWPHS
jgi:digalactosyldiacylglycerol synthase